MCECGCTSNDERFLFPAPGGKVYMLTLSRGCASCDSPSGVIIERISKSDIHAKEPDLYTDGELKFETWNDTEGVAIVTGLRKHEFVNALKESLVGVEVGEDGALDEIGAEVILEEAYDDSVVKPHFPIAVDAE